MLRRLILTLLSIFAAIPAIAHVETASGFTAIDHEIAFTRVDVAAEISLPAIELFEPETRLTLFPSKRKLASGSSTSVAGINYLEPQELSAKSWQGHDYMHARYYSPVMGRFLSVDPSVDLKKTIRNPQMWNRYTYVVNNPIRYTDPDGREHVYEPGFTKPLSEADWSDAPPVVKGAFYAEGGLLAAGAAETALSFGASSLASATPQLMRWGIPLTPVFNFLRNIGAAETGQPSLPFGLSNKGLKHAMGHLSEFQALDKSMNETKLIGLAAQIASKAENYLGSPGGRKNYEQLVTIGEKLVRVRVVINEADNLRSVQIRY